MNGNAPRKAPNRALIGLRLNRGLSPNDLSRLTGVGATTIRLAEKGHRPSPRIMFAIADFFDVPVLDIWPLPGQDRSRVSV